jgi:hypothetical protein
VPDLERRELAGHQPRSQPQVAAWVAIPIGIALLGAAVLLIAYVTSGLPRVGKPRVAPVLVFPFALVTAFLGIGLLASLVARLFRSPRVRRLARSHPGAPWLVDHPWDPRGSPDDTLQRALRSLAGALLVGLFLVPFNWLAFFSRGELPLVGRLLFGLVTGLFDALVIALFIYGLYLLARLATHGTSFLRFERFPFLLGAPLAAGLRVGERAPADRRLNATLRCIEETWESRDSESAGTVCYQVYADTREIAPSFARLPGAREAHLAFDLPSLPLGTRLAARPPRYWEVEVRSEGPGVDYAATFLVPVYEPPASENPRKPAVAVPSGLPIFEP